MKKYINLFLLMIIVHLINGNIVEFPKATYYYYRTDWGKVLSVRIYEGDKKVAEFAGHAVSYIEQKEEK